jgi:hypothetical protein
VGGWTATDMKRKAPVCGRMTRACGRINGYIGNERKYTDSKIVVKFFFRFLAVSFFEHVGA